MAGEKKELSDDRRAYLKEIMPNVVVAPTLLTPVIIHSPLPDNTWRCYLLRLKGEGVEIIFDTFILGQQQTDIAQNGIVEFRVEPWIRLQTTGVTQIPIDALNTTIRDIRDRLIIFGQEEGMQDDSRFPVLDDVLRVLERF